jgi:hypothetical protein
MSCSGEGERDRLRDAVCTTSGERDREKRLPRLGTSRGDRERDLREPLGILMLMVGAPGAG